MNKCKKIICFTLVILFLFADIPFNKYFENSELFTHKAYAAGSEPLSADEQAVADDKTWLNENFSILNDYPFMDWLQTDLIFPPSGPNGSSFTWSSSDICLIDVTGKVNRPAYSGPDSYDVTITATATKGAASDITTFDASVVTLPGSLAVQLDLEDTENDTVSDSVSINGTAALGDKYMSNYHLFSVNSGAEGAGSVFTKDKIQLADDLSFSTYFLFDISSVYMRYDEGFTFTLQADSPTLLGTGELSSMGSPAISPGFSVEFDTKRDSETAAYEYQGADAEHHIAVYLNGDYQHPIAVAPAAIYDNVDIGYTSRNFEANQRFKVWIQYDGTAKRIEIYQVFESMDDPLVPVISASLDLTSVFKTSDNQLVRDVYAGFTGNGADAFSTHAAIYEWSFKNDKFPIGYDLPKMTITGLYLDASDVAVTTETVDIVSGYKSFVTALVKDSSGSAVQGVPVFFTSDSGAFESSEGITADGISAAGITDANGLLTAALTSPIPVIAKVRASAQGGAYAGADASLVETDEARLNKDYSALAAENILGSNESLDFVRSNLTLPLTGANGSTISWASSNTGYLTSAGFVVRPTAAQGDQTVILTAHLVNGISSKDKDFIVKIKINDADLVGLDSDWLTDTLILNGNISWNEVVSNLLMPGTGANGSSIAWVSSSSNITEDGIVSRPLYYEPTAEVALSVTISMGTESVARSFTVKVLPNEATEIELLNEAYNALDFEDIRNENMYENNIAGNLTLPAEGLHGSTISWASS
ncbi:MAG: Ig-like domain-containing protein, partial [Eubacteriales bacterium]|nr:Ig-like domain-containing protein [Eubacteriales bacterium]